MATERQLEANRANSVRSSGPKSLIGKARSSMNACKHGLTAQTVVIGEEDPGQFDALRKALDEEFEPHSLIERELVERLAGIIWRIRRIPKFEAALIEARCADIGIRMPTAPNLRDDFFNPRQSAARRAWQIVPTRSSADECLHESAPNAALHTEPASSGR